MEYITLGVECGTIKVSISSGSLLFTSNPVGADIYVIASGGGPPVYTGLKTPNTIPYLPIGNYDYILKLTGFKDYTGTATVDIDGITIIDANLSPSTSMLVPILTVSAIGILLILT